MSITSHLFLLVFLPVVCVTWRLANRHSSCAARLCLLAAGILFCGWSAPWSLLVLAGEGTATYCLGQAISRPGSRKKPLLAAGAVLVVAVLFLFKYTGFFLAPWTDGLPAWLAPLGLSFSSFQQLFWLRDRYHGETGKVSPLDYACCLTLFATATCGPITRVGELVPQLRRPEPFSWDGLAAGLYCFALGLFKKVLPTRLAERLIPGSLASRKVAQLAKKDREYLALAIHDHMVTPSRSEGMGHAEAAAGGVDTSDVNPRTLESRKQPGLYFAGEVLDVTGLLGGYNLHWAWASGKAVGESWKK